MDFNSKNECHNNEIQSDIVLSKNFEILETPQHHTMGLFWVEVTTNEDGLLLSLKLVV